MTPTDPLYLEKRTFIRYQLQAKGQIIFDDGRRYPGMVRDISIGGIFMETVNIPKKEDIQTIAAVRIQVDIHEQEVVVEAECKIVRLVQNGIGLFFTLMDVRSKKVYRYIMTEIQNSVNG